MKNRFILFIITPIFLLAFGIPSYAQSDYGDAPDPTYPTLTINNGANHMVGPLFMGNQIDVDVDGQPNMQSTGDDSNGTIDDEDGVMFSTWLVPSQNATIIVNASMAGLLDAWIDFQVNGNWTDPGDQIFTNQAVNAGQNTLVFAVPSTASTGINTFGRFRLSSTGGLLPTGMAIDGEVEDYQIVLGNPTTGNTVMDLDAGLSYTQNEISMTIEPASGNIISVYNDTPYAGGPGIGVSYSTDNGVTWSSQQLSLPFNSIAGVSMVDAFDPSVDSDDAGNTFVAQISTDNNWSTGPVSGLFVHKSTNGGVSWNAPATVAIDAAPIGTPDPNYRFNDRCQIRVDKNPLSTYYNNIYVTWIKDRGWNSALPYSDIYVSVSSDGGTTFSAATQINLMTNDLGNLPIPEIAINGDLYVLWVDYNVITGGNGVMLLDKSTDGGVTWGSDVTVNTILLPPLNLNGGADVRARGAAILRTDPSNSNVLYIVYAADPDGAGSDESDIFFIKSTNGGTSWSLPLKLNDDSTTNDQILPWMEVKPNGTIDVAWYDRRNDPSDLLWDIYSTTSINGGTSFTTNAQLNTTSFSTPQTNSGPWFGEYLALTVSSTTAYIGFTSSAIDPQGDVFFTSFNNPPLSINSFNQTLAKIYPNPTHNSISVHKANNLVAELKIYDFTGKVILSTTLIEEKTSIDLKKYAAGIYFIKISTKESSSTQKIVKY
jgi:hypothetical protein